MDKKRIKVFCILVLFITMLTLLLALFYNDAFMPSFMLMLSLFIFGICYYIKDDKKNYMYFLYVVGVLLIIGSLVYTYLRLK